MLNPYNYPKSLRQWLYGAAGLPLTVLRMKMNGSENPGTLLVLCYHRIVHGRNDTPSWTLRQTEKPGTHSRRAAAERSQDLAHGVVPLNGGFCDNYLFIALPEELFISQIKWLTRHYRVVELDEVLSGKPLPPRAALITFDDGFMDTYETALPILNYFRLPATVFLIGSVIRERKIPWVARLHWLLDHARGKGLSTGDLAASNENGRTGGLAGMLGNIKAHLRNRDIQDIEKYLDCLEDRLAAVPLREPARQLFMGEEQVVNLCSYGWTVGNHTDHHLDLGSLGQGRVREEIMHAGETLARFNGYRPVLAIPFGLEGSFSEQTVDAARMSGMEYVFTTLGSPNRFPGSGILLDRVICETFSSLYFRFLASGGRTAAKKILVTLKPAFERPWVWL